jgi:hypothetical protein
VFFPASFSKGLLLTLSALLASLPPLINCHTQLLISWKPQSPTNQPLHTPKISGMALKFCPPDIPPSKEKPDSDLTQAPLEPDVEQQSTDDSPDPQAAKTSAFKGLGLLDRFLAVWILLAMAIGIILGNFVPNTGPALQKGKFVGVSIPIGELQQYIAKRKPC